ncbi:hypothetical protein AVEN_164171-1, partial [Araneus ventricosus]
STPCEGKVRLLPKASQGLRQQKLHSSPYHESFNIPIPSAPQAWSWRRGTFQKVLAPGSCSSVGEADFGLWSSWDGTME